MDRNDLIDCITNDAIGLSNGDLTTVAFTERLRNLLEVADVGETDPLTGPTVEYDHDARPSDDPEPGDRCKDCGHPITWTGPGMYDWLHVMDERNR